MIKVRILYPGRYAKWKDGLCRTEWYDAGDIVEYQRQHYTDDIVKAGLAEYIGDEPERNPDPEPIKVTSILSDHEFLNMDGMTVRRALALVQAGYNTWSDIDLAPDVELLAVEGIGPSTLAKMRSMASERG
jgi:hypothetical protein